METIQTNWKSWLPGALLVVFLGGLWLYPKTPAPVVTPVAEPAIPAFQVNPVLLQAGATVGLTKVELQATHTQIGQGPCNASFIACYIPSTDTIYISQGAFDPTKAASVGSSIAYEYGHHVWEKVLTTEDRVDLMPDLAFVFSKLENNQDFTLTFAPILQYEGKVGSDAFYSEVYSMSCTQVSDSELTPALLTSCKSFAPNRNTLPSLY